MLVNYTLACVKTRNYATSLVQSFRVYFLKITNFTQLLKINCFRFKHWQVLFIAFVLIQLHLQG